ncbi:hypothetical protein [Yoonia sp. BS5-3]|uniref:Uncharacterized protein n=1 Tax=Yoonia phaeophyticola TaxID=3137369 RepID=A0ABZ2V3Z2_9RHOB
MSYTADNTLISNREMIGQLLTRIGNALAIPFVAMVEASAANAILEELNETTDEEFAAQGTTRADAALKAFGRYGY